MKKTILLCRDCEKDIEIFRCACGTIQINDGHFSLMMLKTDRLN